MNPKLEARLDAVEVALLALNNTTKEILVAGGFDPFRNEDGPFGLSCKGLTPKANAFLLGRQDDSGKPANIITFRTKPTT
jgi:hypothetical protein